MPPATLTTQFRADMIATIADHHFGPAFSDEIGDAWVTSANELSISSSSQSFLRDYARDSSEVVKLFGQPTFVSLIDAVCYLKARAGIIAANSLLLNLSVATSHLSDKENFELWLEALCRLADIAPKRVSDICNKSQTLLTKLDGIGFSRWVSSGETSTGGNAERIDRYFALEDEAARQIIELEASTVRLADMEKLLASLPMGLWKQRIILRAAGFSSSQTHVRTSFDNTFIRVPSSYDEVRGDEVAQLFKAAITHIGAHIKYSGERRKPKALKQIQIALISILEDTRAELLAARDYPGLLHLWRSMHRASDRVLLPDQPDKNCACNVIADLTPVTENLLARFARALIDDTYIDDNPWIQKGRKMFFDAGPDWEDPEDIRRIGVLLGNDLGQMRLQFNAKTYVVQPAYRDDNMGIWDFGEPPEQSEEDLDVVTTSMRIEQNEEQSADIERQKPEIEENELRSKSRPIEPDDKGTPICKLPEWDYLAASERPNWVTIMEHQPPTAPAHIISRLVNKHSDVAARIEALVRQSKVGQLKRLKRQREGDHLDLDACIQHRIDMLAGQNSDIGLYETTALSERDLSVLVLLDISQSTKDLINGTATSVFHLERDATALLAQAMDGMNDPFAIHAFCSDGRHDLRYFHIKNFGVAYNDQSKSRLAGIRPGLSTRMGGALRYAGSSIGIQPTRRKLILVITDGEPSDIDVTDPNYLIEDTRKAVLELASHRIDVFAVGLDGKGPTSLPRIFGHRNTVQIHDVASLPERLPMLYFRLVA